MKVIFIADLQSESASGRQRLWALEQSGIEVSVIDKQKYFPKLKRLAGYLGKICRAPSMLVNKPSLQSDIVRLSYSIKPHIIWFEWAKEIAPSVLKMLRQLEPKPFLISFQDDNPWGSRLDDKWQWKDYFKLIPFFDLHLVKRQSDIENLNSLGAKNCRVWQHGIYKPLFFPQETAKVYPISFVGTCMDRREELIGHLLKNNVPVHIFGNKWQRRSNLPRLYPQHFHPAVEGLEYAEVIRKSHVSLGLVSHSNCDEWTMRTYEVPGCSGLLLAERTPTHERLFTEFKEAMFFSNPHECLEKARYLISQPEICKKMGRSAYNRMQDNSSTIEANMKLLLQDLQDTLRLRK